DSPPKAGPPCSGAPFGVVMRASCAIGSRVPSDNALPVLGLTLIHKPFAAPFRTRTQIRAWGGSSARLKSVQQWPIRGAPLSAVKRDGSLKSRLPRIISLVHPVKTRMLRHVRHAGTADHATI